MPDARSRWAFRISAPVFVPTLIFSIALVLAAALIPEQTNALFSNALALVTSRFGWLTMLVASAVLVFLVVIALSPWGKVRLGPDHAKPSYSFWAWFAMLFAAGHGVALVFFGVAEPVIHYASPPQAGLEGIAAAREAMQISFFHWGFHLWAIYGTVGIALAYFSFRHGLPLSMRSALYPLIGDRIYGPIGHAVDVFAALGTLFGLATSLGVSAMQINAGLSHVFPWIPSMTSVQVLLIAVITGLTLFSVALGLDAGIKRLSTFNLTLAIGLLLFVFVMGPTIYILEVFLENISVYVGGVVERTLYLAAYQDKGWMSEWTLFIFSWIIAWAPFVGLFVARISYGRTIREFVFGVIVAPTIATLFWFTTFGGTALHMITQGGDSALLSAVSADLSVALFEVLERLPLSAFAIPLSLVLSGAFFVTSSDSGALVVDSLTAGGETSKSPVQRGMWAIVGGGLAASLLLVGGLMALRAMTVASALPFTLVMVVSTYGFWRALKLESVRDASLRGRSAVADAQPRDNWRRRLARIVDSPQQGAVQTYIEDTAFHALSKIQAEVEAHGLTAEVLAPVPAEAVTLHVRDGQNVDFVYEIRVVGEGDELRAEVFLKRGGQAYDVYGLEEAELIADVLDQLERYLHFLREVGEPLPWHTREA